MWGGFGALGLRGWAGGDGGCQCCESGPDWPISILGAQINPRFSFEWVIFRSSERRRFWGCGVGLGRLGFAGGLVRDSAASLDPIGRFRFGGQINSGFSFNGFGAGCTTGRPRSVFF